ncbi:plasmid mobilization relaxosome protein MobC [Butyrivibrio sp.]|uniref:plasmid mobilization protein n=1 Tax=Butyrivibrio sp. TaxID=28121 RepID=UPI0025B83B78|nr:plasmid mobilization relaxosome protein MobC [Butyrivibrio sp.]MBQ9302869.1 plasmid mobilization relaxosome protein MobC [Butyrivibrio sp.]MCR5671925.1 MobC family plasmid mobilization relaxosome protein [Butyrivibrio sp.]
MTKRKRNKTVTIRMNDAEYDVFQNKVKESGLTHQSYVISAISGSSITSAEELAAIKELSKEFAEHNRLLRGMATNVNQMAHVANGKGLLATVEKLEEISDGITDIRKEDDNRWRLIRQSVSPLKATGA